MRHFSTFAALAFAASPLLAQSGDIAGTYRVEGLNPDGSAYAGALVLTPEGSGYAAAWTTKDASYKGTGTLEGRVLTISYGDPFPAVYVVMEDGELHGTWNDGTALERAEPTD
ncbi:LIC10280 family protein [Sagittula stellata]|uniref:Uncharacterized protein n=1 Tax=Sagittula stellata (strain ATCC 700073 / DSM 11524 / E-37) TaxID=388399 RepID=A3K9Z5_SAGS3|nr:hypothetical protein [Sagittula stellata]EBA05938.1 hypothetical protein SSE37_25058 [Sagittula stellata E-37]